MAPITRSLALAGAFFALTGYSAPVDKRAVVWETVTDIVWTTVDVTTTVDPNSAPSATVPVAAHFAATTPVAAIVTPTETPDESSDESSEQTPNAKEVVPAPSSATPESAPAPSVEAETSSSAPAPAPTEESSAAVSVPAPTTIVETANVRSANIDAVAGTAHTGACSKGSPCDGMITFYDTATTSTNPSSCGNTNDGASENVLALPVGIMKDGDCGKTVTITYNGKTATGTVVDKCMGCDNTSIDLSRHLFGELASLDAGRVGGAKWYIH